MTKWIAALAVTFAVLLGVGFWLPMNTWITPPSSLAPVASPPSVQPAIVATDIKAPPSQPEVPSAERLGDQEPEFVDSVEPLELNPEAIAALRESLTQGDERAPPIARDKPAELPAPDEMDSPEAYLGYEGRQDRKLKAAFVRAVDEQIPLIEQAIAEARATGLEPEQLLEGEEKLRRLKDMREELLSQDPDLTPQTPP